MIKKIKVNLKNHDVTRRSLIRLQEVLQECSSKLQNLINGGEWNKLGKGGGGILEDLIAEVGAKEILFDMLK